MCDWKLPWHYLAGPPCLLSDAASGKEYLKEILDEKNLHPLLDCEQTPDVNEFPPLMAAIREIGKERKRKAGQKNSSVARHITEFDWEKPWPSGLNVKVRSFDRDTYGDFILTQNTLYIRDPRTSGQCKSLSLPKDFKADEAFFSDCFMLVADVLVASADGRKYFSANDDENGAPPTDKDAKTKIIELLDNSSSGRAGVPTCIRVEMTGKKTTETDIAWCNGEFVLHLGWDWSATKGAGPAKGSIQDIKGIDFCQEASFSIPEWPCGAFE